MKTKKDFPFLTFFIAAAASMVALLPLRIYQYFEVLESGTGFYEEKNFSVYLMYILMAFVVVFSFAVSLFNRKTLKNNDSDPSILRSVAYAAAAIGFVVDAASKAIDVVDIYNSYTYSFQMSEFEYLSQNGGLIYVAQAFFAIISAVYFFALAAAGFSKKDVSQNLRTVALAPSLWAAMRLLMKFKSTISFTNVSDLLLELFAVVFVMVFFFAFAQTNSKVDKGESYWKMFAYGIPAAVFSMVCFVPRGIVTVVGYSDLLADGYSAEICDFTVAIMIFVYLISKASISVSNKKA